MHPHSLVMTHESLNWTNDLTTVISNSTPPSLSLSLGAGVFLFSEQRESYNISLHSPLQQHYDSLLSREARVKLVFVSEPEVCDHFAQFTHSDPA